MFDESKDWNCLKSFSKTLEKGLEKNKEKKVDHFVCQNAIDSIML